MHSETRKRFNASFSQEKYEDFLRTMNTAYGEPCTFRYLRDSCFCAGLPARQAVQKGRRYLLCDNCPGLSGAE
jgi:hypothetical protein